jgi:putative NIF3 family GTP cyclohydrolase 1 type 2
MKYLAITIMLLFYTLYGCTSAQNKTEKRTANEVIEAVKANLTCMWSEKTVDTFKAGNPQDQVTGIVATFIVTMDVLNKAVELNCNLIFTHEPTFYNHLDQVEHLKNDPVYQEKLKFINDNGLIIFRFHDHWHRTNPDGIFTGMINKLGWQGNQVESGELIFEFNESTLGVFAAELKVIFENSPVRVIGDPDMKFKKVGLSPGAPGYMSHVRMLERDDVEVLVGGEVPEWESITYVRDAEGLGLKKAMILLGHVNSEEAGMEYLAEWLKGILEDVPVHFVPAGDPFWTP